METFTTKEQTAYRKSFIEECTQKVWGAACHAGWLEKNLNENIGNYQKLQVEDKALEAAIKANLEGPGGHTVENRNKRIGLQKKRNDIAQTQKIIAQNTQMGAASMQKLLDSVEQNLLLAKHAKDWSWVEKAQPKPQTPDHVFVLQKDWVDKKAGETLTREEVGDGSIYKDLIAKGVIVED